MSVAPEQFCFGRWQLDGQRRTLCADGTPVPLNGRAFDLLALLVARHGQAVTREEIFANVWPGINVGENNLTVQVSNLRKVLGHGSDESGLIVTVPGRGYKFAGEVETPRMPPAPTAQAGPSPQPLAPPTLAPHPVAGSKHWAMRAVALAAVPILFLGAAVLIWRPAPTAPRLSIAVLPFRNLSPDHAQDYIADALTDDLTTDLARIPASTVIARESADVWRGKAANVRQIGQALMVRYIVEGSVRAEDGFLHVNVQLIDAYKGNHLWASRFDTVEGRLSDVHEAIVRRLASALDFQLTQLEGNRSLQDRPNDPDALDLFFRARAITDWDDSRPGLMRAQALLEQAIHKQPDFGDALGELGALLVRKVVSMDDPGEDTDIAEAKRVIAHALEVAPRNAQALAARGRLLASANKCDAARSSAAAALAIDNSSVQAEVVLVTCARQEAKLDDAERHLNAIIRLSPDSLLNRTRLADLGYIYLMQSRTKEAVEYLNRALAGEDADKPADNLGRVEIARLFLMAATFMQGEQTKALELWNQYNTFWPNRTVWRISALMSRSDSALPGFKAFVTALRGVGMAWSADERSSVPSEASTCDGGEFAIPPRTLAGGSVGYTQDLIRDLGRKPQPLIIDVGSGMAVPPNSAWFDGDTPSETSEAFALRVASAHDNGSRSAHIVVMGSGFYGCGAYRVSQALIKSGYSRVTWYRGGEESWVTNGGLAIDKRS